MSFRTLYNYNLSFVFQLSNHIQEPHREDTKCDEIILKMKLKMKKAQGTREEIDETYAGSDQCMLQDIKI